MSQIKYGFIVDVAKAYVFVVEYVGYVCWSIKNMACGPVWVCAQLGVHVGNRKLGFPVFNDWSAQKVRCCLHVMLRCRLCHVTKHRMRGIARPVVLFPQAIWVQWFHWCSAIVIVTHVYGVRL